MGDGLIAQGDSGPTAAGGTVNKAVGRHLDRARAPQRDRLDRRDRAAVPHHQLRSGQRRWGINFQRTVRRKNEESVWSGHARNQGLLRMTNAGRLTGLTGMSQGAGLDIKPHAVGSLTTAPGRGRPATIGDGDVGVDIFYSLTPALRANFTVNTDFAETEVDQRRVNLTRFPLFFPEKREFFLEGSGFFDFAREPGNQVEPFFSRRIGLDASFNPQKIDFGLKLTGQLKGQDIGLLQVRTGRDDEDPSISSEDFTVLRVRRRLLTQSYFGGLYTRRAARADGGAPDLHTAGADFNVGTSSFRGSQNLEMSGFWLWNDQPAWDRPEPHLRHPAELSQRRLERARLAAERPAVLQPRRRLQPAVGLPAFFSRRALFAAADHASLHPPLRLGGADRAADRHAEPDAAAKLQPDRASDEDARRRRRAGPDHAAVRTAGDALPDQRGHHPAGGARIYVHPLSCYRHYRQPACRGGGRGVRRRRLLFGQQARDHALPDRAAAPGHPGLDRKRMEPAHAGRRRVLDAGLPGRAERAVQPLDLARQQPAVRHGQRHSRLAGALSLDSSAGQRLFFVYTHNWRELEPERFGTLDRRAVSKVAYTHRF